MKAEKVYETPKIATTFIRGHEVYTENGKDWFYSDHDTPCDEFDRPCKKCGMPCVKGQPDPCIGYLPNIEYACCGHGIEGQDYVYSEELGRLTLNEYHEKVRANLLHG